VFLHRWDPPAASLWTGMVHDQGPSETTVSRTFSRSCVYSASTCAQARAAACWGQLGVLYSFPVHTYHVDQLLGTGTLARCKNTVEDSMTQFTDGVSGFG
jgi:hypothetical protein